MRPDSWLNTMNYEDYINKFFVEHGIESTVWVYDYPTEIAILSERYNIVYKKTGETFEIDPKHLWYEYEVVDLEILKDE